MANPGGDWIDKFAEAASTLFSNMTTEIKAVVEAFQEFGGVADGLVGHIKTLNNESNNTLTGLDKQIALNEELVALYKDRVKNSLILEQRNKQLNKSFGIGVAASAKLSQELQKTANTLGVSGEQTQKYAGSIRKLLPTFNVLNKSQTSFYTDLQRSNHILQTNVGLTEDQTNAYTQYAMQTGKDSTAMIRATKGLADSLDPDGTLGYFKTITQEIAGATSDVQLQYGRIPGSLEVAVLKAKRLGFELQDLADVGTNLLDIESSIGQELEYQLLSGRRLTNSQGQSLTNLYREATIRGDMNKQADVLNNILENEGETLENNMFARKQMADMLGMQENQLASAIQKKKILDKAGDKGIEINLNGSNALDQAAIALEKGAIDQAEFESFKESLDTRTTEDILDEILLVLQEQQPDYNEMLTKDQFDLVTKNQEFIKTEAKNLFGKNSNTLVDLDKSALATAGAAENVAKLAGDMKDILTSIYEIITTPGKGASKTAMIGKTPGNIDTGEDTVIPAGYGRRILSFPQDTLQPSIALNDKDHIMATTKAPTISNSSGGGGGGDLLSFAHIIVAAIKDQTLAMTQAGLNAPRY